MVMRPQGSLSWKQMREAIEVIQCGKAQEYKDGNN
jgi:hypothetical protein